MDHIGVYAKRQPFDYFILIEEHFLTHKDVIPFIDHYLFSRHISDRTAIKFINIKAKDPFIMFIISAIPGEGIPCQSHGIYDELARRILD